MTHAAQRLELSTIRHALLDRVRTPLGSREVAELAPLSDLDTARARIELVRQARFLLDRGEEPPIARAKDVRAALDLGSKGATLDSTQLRATADTMHAAAALRRFLLPLEVEVPGLYAIGASLPDLSRPAEEVSRSFDPAGQLADQASTELGPLRKRLQSLHDSIGEKLGALMRSSAIQPYLQEEYYTVRADRYVLPIKTSHKSEVQGIVHDASGSGQTVFIEPQEVVELGNRLKIAHSEVLEEEHRILTWLTELVVAESEGIRSAMQAIATVDLVTASARFASDVRAAAIFPQATPGFDLIGARHPLLELQRLGNPAALVVPNDLGLLPDQRVLILTGPNTGGKTVAMKTVGLFALMVRCGLHLPCDERSRIGWFDPIEAAIGDQQSIATNLSTFAAHIREIAGLLERADGRSLVLLDEIAADTDPTQGQALAQAILEAFADRDARVVVTTHFERLKAVPFADPRFRNAGVGFDPDKLKPTYRVTLDLPQGSSGLDIAQSLGLDRSIISRARALTGEKSSDFSALMKSLQQKAIALDEARAETERASAELVATKRDLEKKKVELADTKKRILDHERFELLDEIETTRAEVRSLIAQLQRAAGSDAVRDAMRMATEASERMARLDQEEKERIMVARDPLQSQPLSAVEIGDWVHVTKFGKDGEVVGVDGKEILVAVGNMRARVTLDALSVSKSKRPKRATRHATVQLATNRANEAFEELDLRGVGTDEGLERLDGFLDLHYTKPTAFVRIVHGHGTGAMRQAVRDYLKQSGYVRSFRPGNEGEGGDGATVVELA